MDGAREWGRTITALRPPDFESGASASSATRARRQKATEYHRVEAFAHARSFLNGLPDSVLGRIRYIMPLDEIGRRYADSIYQRRLHEISGEEEQVINQLRNQHASRGTILSGAYIHDHFELLLKRVDILAQAKSDGLAQAYEKSGLPFDEAAFGDVKAEVVDFCDSQQHSLIGSMNQEVRQTLGANTPAGTLEALSKQIISRIEAIIYRLVCDLAIKRDEKILDDRKTKQVYAAALGKEWDVFICHASDSLRINCVIRVYLSGTTFSR